MSVDENPTIKTQAMPQHTVWDLPVRLGHWLMVILVAACWWTAENHLITYHTYCAYGLLGILIFRVYWGFVGSSTARFGHFLRKPAAVVNYVRTLPQRNQTMSRGHNPLGGYSVVLLLGTLLAQISLGLFAIDVDGFDGGPFADYLSFETSRQFAEWHEILFNVLLGFIVLHLLAIVYYLVWRRQNLTAAMVGGKAFTPDAGQKKSQGLRAILGIGIAIALVWLISNST